MNRIINGVEELFRKVVNPLAIIFFIIMITALFLQVLTRYVFRAPLIWTEEIGNYSFIWMLFISAGSAFIPDEHIRVTSILNLFPKNIRIIIDILLRFIVLICLTIIIIYGFKYVSNVSYQRSYALRVSKALPVLAIPLGASIMFLGVVHSILLEIKDKDK